MAAGLGFKTFATGDVLTAADTNGYLMQGVWVFADAAARTAAVTSPQEGNMSFLKDTNSTEYYTGSAWAAVGGVSGANWTLLNAGGTALTGATTITVSGISSKDKILVLVAGASSANASSSLTMRFNADSGSNYNSYGSFLNGADTGGDGVRLANSFSNTSSTSIPFGTTYNDASGTVSGGLTLTGGAASGVKQFIFTGAGAASGGQSGQQTYSGQGIYSDSSTISSVSIISSTGNFDAGTIYVYTSA